MHIVGLAQMPILFILGI